MDTKLNLTDYTAKSVVIRGNTRPCKNKLRELGGRWNPNLKLISGEKSPGWIFPSYKKYQLQEYIDWVNKNDCCYPTREVVKNYRLLSHKNYLVNTPKHLTEINNKLRKKHHLSLTQNCYSSKKEDESESESKSESESESESESKEESKEESETVCSYMVVMSVMSVMAALLMCNV